MNISHKLKIMACSAIVALVAVGGIGLFVANDLDETVRYSNKMTIPSIQTIYELKSHQQVMAVSLYRHILSDKAEQMLALKKTIASAYRL